MCARVSGQEIQRRSQLGRLMDVLGVSERSAGRDPGLPRSVQRYVACPRADEDALTAAIIKLASTYGRYGYRRVTALLRQAAWTVDAKLGDRFWTSPSTGRRRRFGGFGGDDVVRSLARCGFGGHRRLGAGEADVRRGRLGVRARAGDACW